MKNKKEKTEITKENKKTRKTIIWLKVLSNKYFWTTIGLVIAAIIGLIVHFSIK